MTGFFRAGPAARGRCSGACWLARAGRRAVCVLVMVLAAAALVQAPATAHSQLVGSDPVPGASLRWPSASVSLTFSDTVEPRFATVTVAVGGQDPVEAPTRIRGAEVIVDVPDTARATASGGGPAAWQVAYRVVAGDGHPITGTLDFTTTASAAAPSSAAPAAPSGSSAGAGSAFRRGGPGAASGPDPAGLSIAQLLGLAVALMAVLGGAVVLVSCRRRRGSW